MKTLWANSFKFHMRVILINHRPPGDIWDIFRETFDIFKKKIVWILYLSPHISKSQNGLLCFSIDRSWLVFYSVILWYWKNTGITLKKFIFSYAFFIRYPLFFRQSVIIIIQVHLTSSRRWIDEADYKIYTNRTDSYNDTW